MEKMEYLQINIQDHTGDRKLVLSWDTGNSASAKEAQKRMEELFIDLQKQGFRFYSCKKVLGLFKRKGQEIKTYDSKLGELIYEEGTSNKTSLLEAEKVNKKEKMTDQKPYTPVIDNVNIERDYVATAPLTAG